MKKFLLLLFGCLIVLLVFATPGQPTQAAEKLSLEEMQRINNALSAGVIVAPEPPADCACHKVTPLLGAEKNKMVAELISSEEFKFVKKEAKDFGYKWSGAHAIQVVKFDATGNILVGVPFVTEKGTQVMFAFSDGFFLGISTM